MTFLSLLIHDITIFNPAALPPTTDRYGNEIPVFDAGTATIGRVDERSSTEYDIDRETRTKSYLVFLQPEVAISAVSYLMWDGHELRVDGEPLMKYDGSGPHHYEVECKEVLG